ncbi:class I SAM-dependent methyltransferase [Streptomyces acidicola]|uniref:class I SAM-dependent methyltransferase n=1 Tax=Streptomyces acidicola TaxID=2596892 RepID=UPI0037F1A0CF
MSVIQEGEGTKRPVSPAESIAQAADAYRDRDMRLARELIFPAVLRRLGPAEGTGQVVLDVGCGTGALAVHLAEARGCTVHGLAPSSAMLDIARADRPHPRVDYRLFDGRSLHWIVDDDVDAVVCCLVYCTDPDDRRLADLTREIHRVLRPGAPYVLADLNPRAIGEAFSTLRYGEPGTVYADGDTVPTTLRRLSGTRHHGLALPLPPPLRSAPHTGRLRLARPRPAAGATASRQRHPSACGDPGRAVHGPHRARGEGAGSVRDPDPIEPGIVVGNRRRPSADDGEPGAEGEPATDAERSQGAGVGIKP